MLENKSRNNMDPGKDCEGEADTEHAFNKNTEDSENVSRGECGFVDSTVITSSSPDLKNSENDSEYKLLSERNYEPDESRADESDQSCTVSSTSLLHTSEEELPIQATIKCKLSNKLETSEIFPSEPTEIIDSQGNKKYVVNSGGINYSWDYTLNSWTPVIDDNYIALHNLTYGFTDASTTNIPKDVDEKCKQNSSSYERECDTQSRGTKFISNTESTDDNVANETQDSSSLTESGNPQAGTSQDRGTKRKAPPTWFEVEDRVNSKVYVSNLPTDITEDEFAQLMQKSGMILKDPETGKLKIKLYTVPGTDILKGDGLCTYIKVESVELALVLLDGLSYRGKIIKVERAKFQMKGEYNPALKPKKKKKNKEKQKKMQEKLFDWRPEKMRGERYRHEKVIVIKNLFEPSTFDRDVKLLNEYYEDLREECSKYGVVKKVVIHENHPEGFAQITMETAEQADACINMLNGRWFGQRQLTAFTWDGKTKYKMGESQTSLNKRLGNWENFLEKSDNEEESPSQVDS